MSNWCICVVILLFLSNANAIVFSTEQLPLSDELQQTFPKLHSRCFIISNSQAGVILHEKNIKNFTQFSGINYFIISAIILKDLIPKQLLSSKYKQIVLSYLETGDSSCLRDILAKENINKILNEYFKNYGAENTLIHENKTTLYDLCCMFWELYDFLRNYNCVGVLDNIYDNSCLLFITIRGFNCAVKIKNKHNEEFTCILQGANSIEQLKEDIEQIKQWLNQFFTYRVTHAGDKIATIPVFYGKENIYDIEINQDHYIILSRRLHTNIKKVCIYKSMLQAPIESGINLGVITYDTSIFKKAVIKYILTNKAIHKGNRLKVIVDSIFYIIFGTPYQNIKICKSTDC
jgi:hypothetical protein